MNQSEGLVTNLSLKCAQAINIALNEFNGLADYILDTDQYPRSTALHEINLYERVSCDRVENSKFGIVLHPIRPNTAQSSFPEGNSVSFFHGGGIYYVIKTDEHRILSRLYYK